MWYNKDMETIVALATPAGNSGVAVIRMSGDLVKDIAQNIINEELEFKPRHMYLKEITCKDIKDTALVVYFSAPNSYTGEDVVEIQSHGGYFLAQKIIEQCVEYGAKLATPGEFSKRAFINGKMSIDQAEGVMDIINAESEMQAKQASNLLIGSLKDKITIFQNTITDILAELEAKIDYPEYEFTDDESNSLQEKLKNLKNDLSTMISNSKNGLKIKNGVNIAIIGAPNVGKSSILNALTNSNKAIVTNVAGTTRDVVEAEYEYNGIIFRLFDTAGIHESDDIVEQIGIDRAKQTLNDADLVLLISDKNTPNNMKTDKPFLKIYNKIDMFGENLDKDYINISAQTGENIDLLKQKIFDYTIGERLNENGFYLTNIRHIECIKSALEHIISASALFDNMTIDVISAELKSAWITLGEISGTTTNETIIDRIFSKFCLGK